MDQKTLPFVIVRGRDSGVHAGYLEALDRATKSVTLRNARRVWKWSGATTLTELAVRGAKNVADCNIAEPLDRIEIVGDVCEVVFTTKEAEHWFASVPHWRYW